jgi:hypothetical protein
MGPGAMLAEPAVREMQPSDENNLNSKNQGAIGCCQGIEVHYIQDRLNDEVLGLAEGINLGVDVFTAL